MFSTSLYTHILEEEIENYTQEAYRILKPGAYMAMYIFSMDSPPPTLGTRHTFAHKIGKACVESMANPESAVAYEDSYLLDVVKRAGFADGRVVTIAGKAQPMLLAHKTKTIEIAE